MPLNINGTTGISGVDGSVSAPAVTGTDSNTGITFPSADTIKFSTGGVERMAITNSGITGITAGITMADQWRVTSNFSYGNAVYTLTANWERVDSDNPGFIGSAMTESSGIFSFPEEGIYRITFKAIHSNTSGAASNNGYIYATTNNSTYSDASICLARNPSANAYVLSYNEFIFDVEDISTHKVKFGVYSSGANSLIYGHTERNGTAVSFMRLGDT
jgi:hypothetical protein